MKNKYFLIFAIFPAGVAFIFSLLSLTKLGGIADADPILTPLRIINRDVALLSLSILSITSYLWKRDG